MLATSRTQLWWQTGVIYQIYPRSFQDSNGDGVGDLAGITLRLDYLTNVLGVDAIWLSPFYRSPMHDFGYDISNHVDVDPIFGTLADFDQLLSDAHARGLRIIIDFVPNHTSDQHPWFVDARSARRSAHHDWYIWRDAKADGSPPNNWLSVFGGSAWEWDATTGQYYLHRYLKEQPDLNWRNPEVKEAMFDVIRFWLDRGVDGFRVDAAQGIMKDLEFRDNPPSVDAETAYKNLGEWDSQLHVYDEGQADIHELYRDLRSVLDGYGEDRSRVLIGEIHVFDYEIWSSYFGDGDEIHLPFNFGLVGAGWDPGRIRGVVDAVERVMRPGAWPTYVLGNHDEHRIASRIGQTQARVAEMLILTLRGTPTLYYGDEIGMVDVPIPPHDSRDPWNVPGLNLNRDPQRTPMRWNGLPNAGFTEADATSWLPIGGDVARVNVEAERQDPRSMLAFSQALLRIRREHRALQFGAYRPIDSDARCMLYERSESGDRLLVALNFSGSRLVLDAGMSGEGQVLLSTHPDQGGFVDLRSIELLGNEGRLILL